MKRLGKLFRLGGFGEGGIDGFARKFLPPDSPNDGTKQRWKINALGQKVPDQGSTPSEIRNQFVEALNSTSSEATIDRENYLRALGLLAEKGDAEAAEVLLLYIEDANDNIRQTAINNLSFVANRPSHPISKKVLERIASSLADPERSIRETIIDIHEKSNLARDISDVETEIQPAHRQDILNARTAAWKQVRDYAIALNAHSKLLLGLLALVSHPVLPVRISTWELLRRSSSDIAGSRIHQIVLLECQASEHRLREAARAFQPAMRAGEDAEAGAVPRTATSNPVRRRE